MITRNNYEVYLIDYMDGSLCSSLVDELYRFLDQNPDIAEEFEGLSSVSLNPPTLKFEGKELLKKKSSIRYGIDSEIDYLLIAELENDITKQEKETLTILQNNNPDIVNKRSKYSKTKLSANLNEKFEFKSSLKRTPVVYIRHRNVQFMLSIAASLLIFVGVFAWVNSALITNETMVAQSHEQKLEETNNTAQANSQEIQTTNKDVAFETLPLKEAKVFNQMPVNIEVETPEMQTTAREPVALEKIEARDIQNLNLAQSSAAIKISIPKNIVMEKPLPQFSQENEVPSKEGTVKEIGLFDVVQMGVNKLAQATGANVRLEGEKNQKGKLTKIEFDSKLFALSTPVRKK